MIRVDYTKAVTQDGTAYVEDVKRNLQAQLILQGHRLTNKLHSTLEITNPKPGEIYLLAQEYLEDLNSGITASVVQGWLANPRRRQEYLNGLTKFFQRRGVRSIRLARSRAIATSKVAAVTGHPTPGSQRFSKSGKRTGALDDAIALTPQPDNFPSFARALESDITNV